MDDAVDDDTLTIVDIEITKTRKLFCSRSRHLMTVVSKTTQHQKVGFNFYEEFLCARKDSSY